MQQGILRHLRAVAALACLSCATTTPARDLAWSYVDEGARIDAAVGASGDVVALTSTATAHAIVRVAPDGRVAWRVELDGSAAQALPRATDFVDEFAPAGERIAGDRTCWTYVRS
ncbi:MAG TPA: hypothetical protein VFL14_15835, partial [Xanthomonadales bacterium]|nr:hypothetical protein [Xanthomonadales bacterium]